MAGAICAPHTTRHMRILTTLFLLLILSAPLFSQRHSIKRDSLFVAWGEKNYAGRGDCSASARIASTDSTLLINIDVVDDKLVLTNDPLQSDHIELWFALSLLYDFEPNSDDSYFSPPYRTSYLWDGNKQLYLFKGKADLKRFEKEIRSPSIGASNYGEEKVSYENLYSLGEFWLKSDIDNYLSEARQSKLTKVRVFYGITHLGILPGSDQIVMYDREAYSVLEKLIGVQVADLSRYATCKTVLKPDGYSLAVSLRPEAIGFAFKNGIPQLRFMLDVVDVDETGRQETVLSTSAKRRWGDPSTFEYLNPYPPIRVHLYAPLPAAGDPRTANYLGNRLHPLNYFSDYFLYTTAGWTPVERVSDPFYAYNQPSGFILENIDKISFRRGILSYRTAMLGKDTLKYLATSQGEYLFVNSRFVYPTRDTLCTFLLSDSSVGLLATRFESSGTFTRSFLSSLALAAGSSEIQLAVMWDGTFIRFTDSLKFEEKDWDRNRVTWDDMDSEKNFDWSTIFRWEKFGRSIVVDLGRAIRVRISWDDLGHNVRSVKLQIR